MTISFNCYFSSIIERQINQDQELRTIFREQENQAHQKNEAEILPEDLYFEEQANIKNEAELLFEDLSFVKDTAPEAVQDIFLSLLSSPEDRPKARLLIPSKVVTLDTQTLLRKIGRYELRDRVLMKLTNTDAERYLWDYVYDKVTRNATPEELDTLSKKASSESNSFKKMENTSTAIFSNILKNTSSVLSHPVTRICMGIAGAIIVFQVATLALAFFQVTILPLITIKIINFAPLYIIRSGNLLHMGYQLLEKWKWTIFLCYTTTSLVNFYFPIPTLQKISKAIYIIAFLPAHIAWIPVNFAAKAFNELRFRSEIASQLIAHHTNKIEANRIAKGIAMGRTLWIQQMTAQAA